jgi:para-nitrobenzyl esterase
MVWLHPGAFSIGSASHPVTYGGRLASYGDVVVVSLNHRLNVFGFLLADGFDGGCANAGMRDIVLALQWVRDNIEGFGGDPNNVTLFGESGGGRKICVLMGMPSAADLFHRAIVQSGAHPRCIPRQQAERFTAGLLQHLGLEPVCLSALQSIPADLLFLQTMKYCEAFSDMGLEAASWMLSPVVDGDLLPDHPFGKDAPEASRGVPLLIGSNKDEAALHLSRWPDTGGITEDNVRRHCRTILGDHTDLVIDAYRSSRPHATPFELLVAVASEDRRILSIEIAEKKSRQGESSTFMYLFTWESNEGQYRSAHTMEVPFVFRTWDRSPIVGNRADREALADIVSNAWIAFAKTGRPSATREAWMPYDETNRATQILDVPPYLAHDPNGTERRLWERLQVGMPWEPGSFVPLLTAAPDPEVG